MVHGGKFVRYFGYVCDLIDAVVRHPLAAVCIEISSQCNRRCSFCPNSLYNRGIAYMDEGLYRRVIDELKEMHFGGRLSFTMYNEPLLDRRLPDLVEYARKQLPAAFFYLNTNGDLLDISTWKSLRTAGIDWFNVSQYDGRLNDNIVKLLSQLEGEEAKHIHVNTFNATRSAYNRGGLVGFGDMLNSPLREPCFRPFVQLNINCSGKAVLCCDDYLGLVEVGDTNHQHVADIWKSRILNTYRRKLLIGGRASLALCDKCNRHVNFGFKRTYRQRTIQSLKKKRIELLKE
jgi:MoaA/NifB/PqqE/SkfB family radical SAM enzyme